MAAHSSLSPTQMGDGAKQEHAGKSIIDGHPTPFLLRFSHSFALAIGISTFFSQLDHMAN
ncbi:hypothetical protein Ancab_017440, partial [Ancistrocladus abbreviatus]